jgi:BlaI family transcriptional regulator, penicillinase repressor
MPKLPQISDAEWEVMKVVWDHGPLTAGDVVRQLSEAREGAAGAGESAWAPRTIKTLLSRLVKKRAVEVKTSPDGKKFLYRARVSREECVRQESRSFISRVFDGSVAPALLHFLQGARLSRDDIQRLRETLRREEESAARDSGDRHTGKSK